MSVSDETCERLVPEILGGNVVSPVWAQDGIMVRVIDVESQDVTAQLFFASATQISTGLTENTLTVADNLGRVIVVRRNCSMRSFRI